ncbi:tryptophan 7-halogenase [Ideonella sp. 4Y16]|uniref:Tryptophan 7-halogenase n=1 Tax=Ideonella alba TaxID=2824118 RepID=A0A940Y5Z4_9BURK|nr:tryptophan halogenase family protein [Ideonella alba]MBQ0928915.1 tryptophan 7-halogenase [Ideonella alba]MBQ0942850.1 tryptophan 7-halogenase [Ideonella alba]
MHDPQALRKIVILGGGTAGWMAALPLAQRLRRGGAAPVIELVESAEIGTIGVGEATLPPIRFFNASLGLDNAEFIRRTQASFKLGIEFADWGKVGESFFHGFGDHGPPIDTRSSYAYWLRLRHEGAIGALADWSVPTEMARQGRFTPPLEGPPSAANAYAYAFHFDAGLYAAYLREHALAAGVVRTEGQVVEVERRPGDGFVSALRLADGRRVEGDLFIDCSGFRALLIEGVMQAGFEDWSHWLPCDRALAVPSGRMAQLPPFTRSAATPAGWTWRIPLQHRTGNGHVYCSRFMDDDEAARLLLAGLPTPATDVPRPIRFTAGRRRRCWVGNVVAVGLSSGFLEPLESTSIQLILDAVGRLLMLLPDRSFEPHLAAEFNRLMARQYESIRDFIILHYTLSRRDDQPFWRELRTMPLPDTLAHQIALFRDSGRVAVLDPDGFAEPSWVAIMNGMGVLPRRHDPLTHGIDAAALRGHFARLREAIVGTVRTMPSHDAFLAALAA